MYIHNYRLLIVCICVFTCHAHIVLPRKGVMSRHDYTFITERKLVCCTCTGKYVCVKPFLNKRVPHKTYT